MARKLGTERTRRALLRSGALALAGGIAGCTESSTNAGNPQSTSTETTPQSTSTDSSGRSFPYLHSASGTTAYGIALDDKPVFGQDDALVDMYYWSELNCKYCSEFVKRIFPQILENEVANGTLRVVALELPYKTENSWPAAILTTCVWKQVADTDPNKYWEWYQTMYEKQKEPGSGWADQENLLNITENVGIDPSPVKSCIDSQGDQIKQKIEEEIPSQSKIPGTPGFILFNRDSEKSSKVVGTQPYETYAAKIKEVQGN
ncbi:DsbA family protein [Halocatena salina]|uniref:Thioredoxin domain-containing protein n=1 Tax=Halocatena salina TaxID=2934340 RepID=A0A8U0A7S2_9EURY|nr:thioredoxin domain-containing protein [Halocatena salina]UPM45185.1 thioredoxin domain-containing protein [Halocatena salina]